MTRPPVSPADILRLELARAGIMAVIPRVVRSSQAVTYTVGVQSRDVGALLAPGMADRLAHALAVSHVRVARDHRAVMVQASLPPLERRPVPLASLPHGAGLAVPIGRDVMGRVVSLDLADNATPHALACGTTGSGKSTLLATIVAGIGRQCDPADVRLVLVDGKGETFGAFTRLAHLEKPVVTDPRDGAGILTWAVAELGRRADGWAERLIIVIDELSMILSETGGPNGSAARDLARLVSLGRSRGVHVIAATQHATVDVIGGSIAKACLPCRITGRVTDAPASVLATGQRGLDAHRLSGAGDMLMVAGGEIRRLQVALTSAADVAALPVRDIIHMEFAAGDRGVVDAAAPVHPSQVARPTLDAEVRWAIDNGREWPDGTRRPAGVDRIRERFAPMGTPAAQRIRDAASAALAHGGYDPFPEYVPGPVAAALGAA